MEELFIVEKSVSNAIEEDATLSTKGRALVLTALSNSASMADLIIRFMDKKMVEMRFSRYSETKAFRLISALVRRKFLT